MIEKRLIDKGVRMSELQNFAELPKHNDKKDVFRGICNRSEWPKNPSTFVEKLMYVLAETGLDDFPEFSSKERAGQKKYLGEDKYSLFVAQQIAARMLGELNQSKHSQYDPSLNLDKLYLEILE